MWQCLTRHSPCLPFLRRLVMASALGLAFLAFQSVMGSLWPTPAALKAPSLASSYCLPSNAAKVDGRLMLGGLLFGAGWGISGMCPGPALVAMAAVGSPQIAAYLVGLVSAMALEPVISKAASCACLRAPQLP